MKSARTALVSALIALGAVACAKPNDLGKLEEEATATARRFQPELAHLDERVAAIIAQGDKLPSTTPGTDVAVATLARARGGLQQIRATAPELAKKIAAAEASPDPADGLHRVIESTAEEYETKITMIRADVTSVESWLAEAGRRPVVALPPPPPPPVAPPPADAPAATPPAATPPAATPPAAIEPAVVPEPARRRAR